MSERALLLHGVLVADATCPEGPCAPRLVAAGGLSALVSAAPDDLDGDALAAAALDHHRLLVACLAAGGVCPVRFGTVLPDEAAVRRLLSDRAADFADRLARVGGAAEFDVSLTLPTPDRAAEDLPPVSGRDYLAARGAALAVGRQARAGAASAALALMAAPLSHARAIATVSREDGAQAAALVPRVGERAFRLGLADLADRVGSLGGRLEASGPWPPYSFVGAVGREGAA